MSRGVHLYTLQGSDSSSLSTCHALTPTSLPPPHAHTPSGSWPILMEGGIDEARTTYSHKCVLRHSIAPTSNPPIAHLPTCTNLTPTQKSDQKSWLYRNTRALEPKSKAGRVWDAPLRKEQH